MKEGTLLGMNKTGIQMAPVMSKQMIKGVEEYSKQMGVDFDGLDTFEKKDYSFVRNEYAKESEAIGTVPLPGSLKGAGQSMLGKLKGRNPEVYIDKLAERLAFERSGVRLYDALIAKCEASRLETPLEVLRNIRDEEARHYFMLKDALLSLGADPTAQPPSADVGAVASMGLIQVLTDPRTSVTHAAQAIMIAELTDNAAWELLIMLAKDMGMSEHVRAFTEASENEERHLVHIRSWYNSMVMQDEHRELTKGEVAERRNEDSSDWLVPPIS